MSADRIRYEVTYTDGCCVDKVKVGAVMIDRGDEEPGEVRQWTVWDSVVGDITGVIVGVALGPHTPEQIERERIEDEARESTP